MDRCSINNYYVLLGIVLIALSCFTLTTSAVSLLPIMVLSGMVAIYKGMLEIVISSILIELKDGDNLKRVLVGLIDVLIGCYLLVHISLGLFLLPYVFAVWFTLDSFILILISVKYKISKNFNYFAILTINMILTMIGISLFIYPVFSLIKVSMYLFLSGINYIIYSLHLLFYKN